MNFTNRQINEIEHDRFLVRSDAEKIWGHASLAGQRRVLRRVDKFVRLGDIRPEKKILELGCGTGVFTAELAKTGADITALDLSSDLLAIVKNKISAANVRFVEGNAEKLGELFANSEFDVVLGNSVLHHLDSRAAMKSIFTVLKPGGVVIFSEPNMLNPQIALQKNIGWLKKMMGDSPDETAFFRWQLERLLKDAGYGDVKITPFDFLHPAIPAGLVPFVEKFGLFLEKVPMVREIAGSLLIYGKK